MAREIRIAVDLAMLEPERAGISRYLREVLTRMVAADIPNLRWYGYGRRPSQGAVFPAAGLRGRWDGLPEDFGRVASLFTTLPLWISRDRPDLFWGPAHRLPLWLPPRVAGVVTIHDLCWFRVPETMRAVTRLLDQWLMPPSVKRAHTVIAVSQATADDLEAQIPAARGKVRVIHGGTTALPRPGPIDSLGLGLSSKGYLLFVGTREPRKNLPRVLDAYELAGRNATDWPKLVIAGGSGWGEDFAIEVTRRRLSGSVLLAGRLADQELATLYKHAVSLVMPSLHEGFGLPLLEAMSQGTPVVTSNLSSMPEIAADAGLFVNPYSVSSIAQGLRCMVMDHELRSELASRTKSRARQFSWDRAAEETLAVLCDAAGEATRW